MSKDAPVPGSGATTLQRLYLEAVAHRDSTWAEVRAANLAGDHELAGALSEALSTQRRYCWALYQRLDDRLRHRRGLPVAVGPEGGEESWLDPDVPAIAVEFERLVAHYREAVATDCFAAGPLRSAEVASRVLSAMSPPS